MDDKRGNGSKASPLPRFTVRKVRTERRRYCILGVSLRRTQIGIWTDLVSTNDSPFPHVSIEPGSGALNRGLFFFFFFLQHKPLRLRHTLPRTSFRVAYDDVKPLVRTQWTREVLSTEMPFPPPPRTRPNLVSEKTRREMSECGRHHGSFAVG